MQLAGVVEKGVSISSFSVKNQKARSLFILADGKRTLSQILDMCNLGTQEGIKIVEEMIEKGYLKVHGSTARPKTEEYAVSSNSATIDDDFISMLTTELAAFIGPVAPIVIEDALVDVGPSATQSELLVEVANAIPDESDRRKLLESIQSKI